MFCVALQTKSKINPFYVRKKQRKLKTITIFFFASARLLVRTTLIAYELHALPYTHYQNVFEMLDVDK